MSATNNSQEPSDQEIVLTGFSVFNLKANRRVFNDFINQHQRDRYYITQLENLLHSNGIDIPEEMSVLSRIEQTAAPGNASNSVMEDGSLSSLAKSISLIKEQLHTHEIYTQFRGVHFWNMVPETKIPTVGSTLSNMFFGSGQKHRVDILKDLTGRILPNRMTLVMGPPGCG